MSRWKACAIHFSISLAVFLLLLGIILMVWYPGILFSIDGGWTGLRIVIGVDLVLGPLLTLIVFKSGKPGLKFDLTCIGLAQAACMAAGMWIVYAERPVALVLAYDTFYSLDTEEFEAYNKDVTALRAFPGPYPKLLYTELPENDVSADIISIRSQFVGDPLYIQTERYRSLRDAAGDSQAVFRREQSVRATVSDALQAQLPENCLLSKFVSSVTTGFVCFDRQEQRIEQFFGNEYMRAE